MKAKMQNDNVKFSSEETKMVPHLDLIESDLPEIKDWKVGEEYNLSIKVKLITSTQRDGEEMHDCFDITEVKVEEKE